MIAFGWQKAKTEYFCLFRLNSNGREVIWINHVTNSYCKFNFEITENVTSPHTIHFCNDLEEAKKFADDFLKAAGYTLIDKEFNNKLEVML